MGSRNSNVVLVTVATPVADPTFAPVAGAYQGTQNVVLSCATGGATILYTINGADPLLFGIPYTTPIAVALPGLTIRAIAIKAGLADSDEVSAAYVISPAPPVKQAAVLAESNSEFPYLGAWESPGEGYTNPSLSGNPADITTGGNVHGGVGTLTEQGGDTFLAANVITVGFVDFLGTNYNIISLKASAGLTPFTTLSLTKAGGATHTYNVAAATFTPSNPPPLAPADHIWMWIATGDWAPGVITTVEIQ